MSASHASRSEKILRGNEPLLVDGRSAWVVLSGSVALYAVRPDPREAAMDGPRQHLFTLGEGEAMLWSSPPKTGLILLAVAIEEARLLETSLAAVAESALEGDPEATAMLRKWAGQLCNDPDPLRGAEQILAAVDALELEFVEGIARMDRLREERERRRFDERRQFDATLARHTIASLATVASTTPENPPSPQGSTLLAAVRRVGQAQGLTLRAAQDDLASRDPLEAILDASQARSRKVLLAGRWWTADCGPLLAYRAASSESGVAPAAAIPVALIPWRRSIFAPARYRLYEGSGPGIAVTETIAHSLEPVAVALYTPLPARTATLDLLRFAFRGRRRECVSAALAALGVTLLGMLTPQATLILFEYAIPDADKLTLIHIALGLTAAAAGALLIDLARSFSMVRLETYVVASLQGGLWDRLLQQSPAFFRRYTTGDLASRADTIAHVRQYLNESSLSAMFMSLVALLHFVLMAYYSVSLALAALAAAIVAAAISATSGYWMLKILRPLQELEGDLFGLMVQLVNAVPKLRIAGAEGRAFAEWAQMYARKQRLRQELQILGDRVRLSGMMAPPLASALLFWLAYSSLNSGGGGGLTLGAFIAFNAAFGAFLGGATALGDSAILLLSAGSLWKRMRPILDAEPEIDLRKFHPGPLRGRIAIDHVTFRYRADGPLTLDDVSVRVESGECIAIVGPSGSGKSTLINLLLKFESPDQGGVYYDGHDLNGLDVHAVRRQLGVVTQENKIMAGAVYENIVCGSLCTMDQAWQAARAAGLAEDIEQMPMGMHTVVSEGGGNISGGQRQRLLIARALIQNPRILILDEATSALDNRTQAIVTQSLDNLKVTRIIVAHRLSTIRSANRIYVMDRGRVIQEGRFDDLLQQDGMFRRLMQRQMV